MIYTNLSYLLPLKLEGEIHKHFLQPHLEHLHVGPELLDECLDDLLVGGSAGHPDALGGHLGEG